MMRIAPAVLIAVTVAAQSAPFDVLQLTNNYYAEGANVGDFDNDGIADIVAGPFWWQGPDYTTQHTLYAPVQFPIAGYSDSFCSFVHDVDGDGWQDVIRIGLPGLPAHWYENPQQQPGPWPQHLLFASVLTEAPGLHQLVTGGGPELVCGSGNELGYLTPDPAAATNAWLFHPIAALPVPLTFLHGMGVGDVNGDGRPDLLTGVAWFEQPASLVGDPTWQLHPYSFGILQGSQMFAYDVDGDGDNDLISSRNAHGYGLSWFEHDNSGGAIAFVEHVILPTNPNPGPGVVQFSQLHALDLVDVNGDGLRDIVTGKTFWAHLGSDPGATDPAVLYWFELQRNGATVDFVPHLVHSDSGVGRQVVATDVNADGRTDLVVSNKKGVFTFRRSALWSDVDTLSIAAGGSQALSLDAGANMAGAIYVMVGSLSGTAPGVSLGSVHVPLNPDSYTEFSLSGDPTFFAGFVGALDANGRANALWQLPAGLPLPALQLHHAFVALDSQGAILSASNAAVVRLQ